MMYELRSERISPYKRPGIPGPRTPVGEIIPGLYQRSLVTTSAFVITAPDDRDGPSASIVDAGWRLFDVRYLLNYLRELGYRPGMVRQLISTHWHPDHVGGMAELQQSTGAAVAAHRVEAPYLRGETGDDIPHPVNHRWVRALLWPVSSEMRPRPFPVATELDDGDTLPLLHGAQVVHTPGHTPGSISLHFPDDGALLVGDALQREGDRVTLPAPLFTRDMEEAKRSVRKLAELDFEIICFSHFPPMRKGARAALRSLAEYVS